MAASPSPGVPCRSCTDFQTWSKAQTQKNTKASKVAEKIRSTECPLDKDELGKSTWSFLHTMAAYFPAKPSPDESNRMTKFLDILPDFYPCQHCAEDLKIDLKSNPPETQSQHSLSQWMCRLHNRVNVKLGKAEFDCSKVDERWRDGWKDGSCD